MKIFENHKFNWKGKTIVFFAIVIVTGIPWWISTYTQYLTNSLYSNISFNVCAISAGILTYISSIKREKLF
jgi:hypothetical protein